MYIFYNALDCQMYLGLLILQNTLEVNLFICDIAFLVDVSDDGFSFLGFFL